MSWTEIFKKYGFKYLWHDIWYRLDWRKPNTGSIKKMLQEQVAIAYNLKAEGKIPTFKGVNRDKKLLQCLEWVHDNITYEIDSKRFGVAEKWQTINETLSYKRGDCEDGAILIYCIARANGLSPGQLNLVAGSVKGGGHCWVEYFPDELYDETTSIFDRDNWYTIDWCYWYDKRKFAERPARDKSKYLKPWFQLTDFAI